MSVGPFLRRSLLWGGLLALAVAVVGGVVGVLAAGVPGLVGALVGAGAAAVFLGLTAASMLLAGRITRGDTTSPVFFGVVLAVWFLKLVVFVVLALFARGASWMDPWAFFGCAVAAVIGSLVIDMVVYQTSRVPYVDVPLPGHDDPSGRPPNP